MRELLTARFKRGKIELRLDTPATPRTRLAAAAARAARTVWRGSKAWCTAGCPKRAACRSTRCCSGARAARQPRRSTRPRSKPRGAASPACARRARAKASGWSRCCWSGSSTCASSPRRPSRWCRQPCKRQQQRFLERWQEALEATGAAQTIAREALQERALNEAAAYAIRIDVAEELARLRSHLDEIARLLGQGGEVGKRLDFLIQELLREANTLGSKAATLELTNISVEMKVAIEQLREQVQNIE